MVEDNFTKWLNQNSKFVKIRVGQSYECIFREMDFDENGGFEGKPTVKYQLETYEGSVVELSSSSKALARQMQEFEDGDKIVITATLDDNDRKTYKAHKIGHALDDDNRPIKDLAQEEIPDSSSKTPRKRLPF